MVWVFICPKSSGRLQKGGKTNLVLSMTIKLLAAVVIPHLKTMLKGENLWIF
jgi:hypothetical protein